MTVYGLIPCGGKGTRLGLPFPKEMLPQKGYEYYNPLINHTVEKMITAGATYIYFVHGTEFKQEIVDYYHQPHFIHIKQTTPGFARVLIDFYNNVLLNEEDQVLFGLPDSVYEGNPFISMVQRKGLICGLFITDNPETKVDRLTVDAMGFQIKSPKRIDNQDWFWGVLKFDGKTFFDLSQVLEFGAWSSSKYNEIGQILNRMPHTLIKNGSYNDLGTWIDYNSYLSDNGMSIYD